MAQLERAVRVEWVNDSAEIHEKYGVSNVHRNLGQVFACSLVSHPCLAAFMMGTLIKGLGVDHVV